MKRLAPLIFLALLACGPLAPRERGPRENSPPAETPRRPGGGENSGGGRIGPAPTYPGVRTIGAPIAGTITIGAIADCQYADQPDNGQRLYRRAPQKLKEAVAELNAARPAFTVHLGDFTDTGWESFDVVAPIYASLAAPAHHVLGNHEFSVPDARKPQVPARLGIPQRYRDFAQNGWRFVLLDGNDVSLHAHAAGSAAQADARAFRDRVAPGAGDSGGALGLVQLTWLDVVLAEADAAGEFAVVMCHFPVLPAGGVTLWNAAEVVSVLRAHPSVKLYLAGHDHAGSYVEAHGIHFLTLQGMLDTTDNAWATLTLAPQEIAVDGRGRVPDRKLALR